MINISVKTVLWYLIEVSEHSDWLEILFCLMKDTRYRLDPLVYAPLLGLRGKQTAVQDDVIQFKP